MSGDACTEAKEAMFFSTHTADAPWTVVTSTDKNRAQTEAVRHVLAQSWPGGPAL